MGRYTHAHAHIHIYTYIDTHIHIYIYICEFRCIYCDDDYTADTSDSIKERTCEHLYACRLKRKDLVFHKHFTEKDNGNEGWYTGKMSLRCYAPPAHGSSGHGSSGHTRQATNIKVARRT